MKILNHTIIKLPSPFGEGLGMVFFVSRKARKGQPPQSPKGEVEAFKIIGIFNSECLQTHDTQAPFTFGGRVGDGGFFPLGDRGGCFEKFPNFTP